MASYSITVSSYFNLLGMGRTNRWGDSAPSGTTLTWQSAGAATFNNFWGDQKDLEIKIQKQISTNMGFDIDPQKNVTKQINTTLDMSSSVGKRVQKAMTSTLGLTSSMTTLTKQNNGWDYVYPDGTTNAVTRTITEYSSVSSTDTTWSEQTYPTTTWSEV